MNKEQQDKNWRKLSEDGKQSRIASYQELLKLQKEGKGSYLITIEDLEKLYGSHNLQPKPKIRTWEDVEESEKLLSINYDRRHTHLTLDNNIVNTKVINKIIATYKIAHLINKGYGGMVTEDEWKLSTSYIKETALWSIVCEYKVESKEPQFRIAANWAAPDLLSFHTKQQAQEFMSYPENVELVRQYNLL